MSQATVRMTAQSATPKSTPMAIPLVAWKVSRSICGGAGAAVELLPFSRGATTRSKSAVVFTVLMAAYRRATRA